METRKIQMLICAVRSFRQQLNSPEDANPQNLLYNYYVFGSSDTLATLIVSLLTKQRNHQHRRAFTPGAAQKEI